MSKERQKYKIAGAATWELIRAAYLGGESAPALAERFGVSAHAIRKRISKEGWTKRDYAASLEARGLRPAERVRPDYVEEGVLREEMRVAAEEVEAAKRDAEVGAWIEKVAAEEEAFDIADALERRALAQASAAVVQGRSKDAQALAALAEQMRKHKSERAAASAAAVPAGIRVAQFSGAPAMLDGDLEQQILLQMREAIGQGRAGDAKTLAGLADQVRKRAEEERASAEAADASEEAERGDVVEAMMEIFARAAFLAGAMVHDPNAAPASFLRMVARWRELNLGEGVADAEEAAARVAAAQRHHLDGSWLESTPEDVRAYLAARWEEVRRSFG